MLNNSHATAGAKPLTDYLTFKHIETEYPNTVTAGTLYVWHCTKRHGFDKIVTKLGNKSLVRRDRWEAFLNARTLCASEPIAA